MQLSVHNSESSKLCLHLLGKCSISNQYFAILSLAPTSFLGHYDWQEKERQQSIGWKGALAERSVLKYKFSLLITIRLLIVLAWENLLKNKSNFPTSFPGSLLFPLPGTRLSNFPMVIKKIHSRSLITWLCIDIVRRNLLLVIQSWEKWNLEQFEILSRNHWELCVAEMLKVLTCNPENDQID